MYYNSLRVPPRSKNSYYDACNSDQIGGVLCVFKCKKDGHEASQACGCSIRRELKEKYHRECYDRQYIDEERISRDAGPNTNENHKVFQKCFNGNGDFQSISCMLIDSAMGMGPTHIYCNYFSDDQVEHNLYSKYIDYALKPANFDFDRCEIVRMNEKQYDELEKGRLERVVATRKINSEGDRAVIFSKKRMPDENATEITKMNHTNETAKHDRQITREQISNALNFLYKANIQHHNEKKNPSSHKPSIKHLKKRTISSNNNSVDQDSYFVIPRKSEQQAMTMGHKNIEQSLPQESIRTLPQEKHDNSQNNTDIKPNPTQKPFRSRFKKLSKKKIQKNNDSQTSNSQTEKNNTNELLLLQQNTQFTTGESLKSVKKKEKQMSDEVHRKEMRWKYLSDIKKTYESINPSIPLQRQFIGGIGEGLISTEVFLCLIMIQCFVLFFYLLMFVRVLRIRS